MDFLAYYDTGSSAAAFAILGIVYLIIFLIAIASYVIGAFFLMKIFEKAGVEGKWRAWVPVYNYMVFGKLGDISPWVVLGAVVLNIIPILNYITWVALVAVLIMAAVRVNQKLGKEWPLLLLFLIPSVGVLIWLGILAFGSARWNNAIAPAPWANSFIGDKTVWNGIPVQPGSGYAQPAPGSYPPPAGYQAPPPGYTAPPAPGTATPPPAGPTSPPAGPTSPPPAPPQQPPAPPQP